MAHFIRFALISLEKNILLFRQNKSTFLLNKFLPPPYPFIWVPRFLKIIFGKEPKPLAEIFGKTNVVWKVFQQLGKVVFKNPDSKENHHYISNFRKSYQQQIISYFTKSRLQLFFPKSNDLQACSPLFFGCIVSPENAFYTFRNADLRNTSSNGTFFLSFWDLGFSFYYYYYTYYCILVLHAKSTLNLVSKVEQQTKARTKYLLLFPQMLLLYLLHSPKNSPWSQKYVFLSAILLDCILQESFFQLGQNAILY